MTFDLLAQISRSAFYSSMFSYGEKRINLGLTQCKSQLRILNEEIFHNKSFEGNQTTYWTLGNHPWLTGWPVTNRTAKISNFGPKFWFHCNIAIISIFAKVSRFPKPSLKFLYLYPNRSCQWKTTFWKRAKSPHLILHFISFPTLNSQYFGTKICKKLARGLLY